MYWLRGSERGDTQTNMRPRLAKSSFILSLMCVWEKHKDQSNWFVQNIIQSKMSAAEISCIHSLLPIILFNIHINKRQRPVWSGTTCSITRHNQVSQDKILSWFWAFSALYTSIHQTLKDLYPGAKPRAPSCDCLGHFLGLLKVLLYLGLSRD